MLSWFTCMTFLSLFLSSAKAIDEYASLRSKATESNADVADVDPRLEAIVERMLDKYVKINFSDLIYLHSLSCCLTVFHLGVSWMENTNKLWELQLIAEDWISLRKQY